MSVLSEVIDFWADDLTQNVDALDNVTLHKYTSKAIESLIPDGRGHLAVWPVQDRPQQSVGTFGKSPYTTGQVTTENTFQILYWEPSEEGQFIKDEEDAAKTLMDLGEAIRARFLIQTSRTLSISTGENVWRTDWTGTQYDTGGAVSNTGVRFIGISFSAQCVLDYVDA